MKGRLLLLVLALLVSNSSPGQALRLPAPPQQHARWDAPANIPANLLSAVNALCEQGFPDPRGCEYREIEVEVSGIWGGNRGAVRTHGWLLPEQPSNPQRFAICWNGLVYPATNVGGAADFHAEAAMLSGITSSRFNAAIGEVSSVVSTNALSTRVPLLLRAGETQAALTNCRPADRFGRETNTNAYDPYLQIASDWAWALFDRTICAHMRGNEALALATARTLAEVQPKIEAEAARRGFPRQRYFDSPQNKEKPYLDFLDQSPQLLADLQRREREGSHVSVLKSGLTNITDPAARIAALIHDLDLVAARQWAQPGWVILAEDPIVKTLIQEGDAAVEPLLDCLEKDKRLTRSVGFSRDFFRSRTVVPVQSAARTALLAILQANFSNSTEMRAYWQKYKGLKIEERWYVILKDEAAGMGRWLEAAGMLTQPTNVRSVPQTGFSITFPAPTNAPVPLRGEVLRAKTGPSVSELLARRALELPANNVASYDLSAGCEMALRLAAWDNAAVAPVAKTLVERCRVALEYSEAGKGGGLQRLVARLTLARAQNGDAAAFADYVACMRGSTPAQLDQALAETLEPLVRFTTNQTMQAAAESLFNDTNSAWSKLPWKVTGFYNPVESDLASVTAFRRLLARELDRKEVCGSIEWRAPNSVSIQLTNILQENSGRGLELREPDRPANGTKAELRWCDWVATCLSSTKRIPVFNPFAPEAEREESIRDAKELLLRKEP